MAPIVQFTSDMVSSLKEDEFLSNKVKKSSDS